MNYKTEINRKVGTCLDWCSNRGAKSVVEDVKTPTAMVGAPRKDPHVKKPRERRDKRARKMRARNSRVRRLASRPGG